MKFSITLVTAALLLAGCPDSKLPKVPPSAPEPKADVSNQPQSGVAANRDSYRSNVYRTSVT